MTNKIISLVLLSIFFAASTALSVCAAPTKAKPTASRSQRECERAYRQFFDAQKTIKLNVTKGSVIVEPDSRKFTVSKSSKFKFVGYLKITVDGAGTIEKSFPNGEHGGRVTFDGNGTISYNDSGEVVFEGKGSGLDVITVIDDKGEATRKAKLRGLYATADMVTKVVLLDNTYAVVTNCNFVDAYRNSVVFAQDCNDVSAYTEAQVRVERCKKTTCHDNAKLTEVKSESQ